MDSIYPDENYPDISGIDWRSLDDVAKRTYWRERKMEFLASDHHTVKGFITERGVDENTYWQKGWVKEKAMVIRNAEMMASRQMSNQIADVIQLAYNVEGYAISVLANKLKKENSTMKVTDVIAIVNLMRLLQGKPSSVESARAKRDETNDLVVIDIDGRNVRDE
jgi:hypothetical protein